ALRGRALAGSMGNARARIFCSKNEAELVSIDGYYRTAEEMDASLRSRPAQCWLEKRVLAIAALDWNMAETESTSTESTSKVIVVTSGKGGVGKTTSTAALGAALAQAGQNVVVVDFDVGLRNLDLVMGAERRVVFDLINVVQGDAKLAQ